VRSTIPQIAGADSSNCWRLVGLAAPHRSSFTSYV
jgi:hypothetical protein